MRYLLDTNLCIDLMRGKAAAAFQKLRTLPSDAAGISSITLAELRYGAAKSSRPGHHHGLVLAFCTPLAVAPFDSEAAEIYGAIRTALESAGTPIGPLDLLIAAHCLSLDAVLLTANQREFRRVPGLRVENWR